jgi:hypothetical protein
LPKFGSRIIRMRGPHSQAQRRHAAAHGVARSCFKPDCQQASDAFHVFNLPKAPTTPFIDAAGMSNSTLFSGRPDAFNF